MSFRSLVLLLITALFICSCNGAGGTDSVYTRLNNVEKQVRDINSQLNMSNEGVVPGQAEMWAQMQSIRQDLNQVLGQMNDWDIQSAGGDNFAQLQARVKRLEGTVRKMASVLAIDVSELDAPLPVSASSASPMNQGGMYQGGTPHGGSGGPTVYGSSGSAGTGVDTTGLTPGAAAIAAGEGAIVEDPGLSGEPRYTDITGATAGAATDGGVAVGAGASTATDAPVEAAQMTTGSTDLANTLYNSGTKAFSDRRYKDAVKIFQDFVKGYPTHKLTSNAYFWEGESHYQLKNYSSAIVAYQQIIDKFPGSNKLQSAMFKQGVSMFERGQKEAGKIRLNELISKYPKSQEADRAKQFLKSNP